MNAITTLQLTTEKPRYVEVCTFKSTASHRDPADPTKWIPSRTEKIPSYTGIFWGIGQYSNGTEEMGNHMIVEKEDGTFDTPDVSACRFLEPTASLLEQPAK